jgi:hypothetical protein
MQYVYIVTGGADLKFLYRMHLSEFTHDYARNYTISSHPLATYALTRQTQQFSVKEMEIKRSCEQEEGFLPPVLFNSVRYYWLILNKSILNILSQLNISKLI